jgi:hypothetical protein
MSHALSPPTPLSSLRRAAARLWADPDSRSVIIGIIAVLVVHLFLFATAPYLLRTDASRGQQAKHALPRTFSIEIAPDTFTRAPTQKPTKYVEANPNAPDKVPVDTTNFSSQNSVLAQEKPQKDQHNDTPKLDGKKDVNSNQVVSGQLSKPQDTVPPVPDATKPAKAEAAARQLQNPLTGYEKTPDTGDGYASNLGTVQDQAKTAPQKQDGVRDAPQVADAQNTEPAIDPKRPRARPVLENIQTRPAVFKDNQFGTSNIGPVSYDAKWSSYGAYLHKMIEAIQIQWDRILIDSRTEPPSGTTVTVKFTLDSHGKITQILDLESNSSEQGKQSCVSAITITAPYGEWTDDMKAVLGDSQDLTFDFYYQ